jgi:4-amino-4-deoxy-L-arabinose transferase-like glycosyltransferase
MPHDPLVKTLSTLHAAPSQRVINFLIRFAGGPGAPLRMSRSAPRWQPLLILLGLFAVLYGVDLAMPRDLWVQDEARYGEVVREMLADGQWLIPHLNGHPYPDKPPLYFWLVAALGSVVGHGELAFRLISVLSTLAAMSGVWRVAQQLAGRRAAFWSSALFLSMLLTLVVGHIFRMDMALTAAAVFAWDALLRRRADAGRASLLAFWGFTALTVALKGPVGLAFTLLPALVWLAWEEGAGLWRRLHPIAGVAGIAALVAAWISAALATGNGAYLETVWHEQLLGRAVKSWSHREPVYFYLALLPFLLMPWSGLVGAGMWRLHRRRNLAWRSLASFTLPPLIVLSLVSGKLFIYLQPLLPGLALAGGVAAATLNRRALMPGWVAFPPPLFFGALAIALAWAAGHALQPVRDSVEPAAIGFALVAFAGLALAGCRGRIWLRGWFVLAAVVNALLFGVLTHALNPLFSPRELGEYIAARAAPSTPVGVVNATRGILNIYAGRRFDELSLTEALPWMRAHPDAFIIVKDEDAQASGIVPANCSERRTFVIELKKYDVLHACTR